MGMTQTHDELQALAHDHLVQQFARNGAFGPGLAELPVYVRGEGCEVIDTRGVRHLDALSGMFCMQLGYDHGAEIAEAAAEQLAAIPYTTNWSTATPAAINLAAELAARAPEDITHAFFTCGGSESVESAWKIARQHFVQKGEPARHKVIARKIAYHGVNLGALAISGVDSYKAPFGPPALEVRHVSNTNRVPPARGRRRRRVLRAPAGGDRGGHHRGGPGDDRDAHCGADPERGRLLHAADRLLAGPAGARRPARVPSARRRGDLGLRAPGRVLRGDPLRRRPRRHHARQGAHLRPRPDGRRHALRGDRGRAARAGLHADARPHLRGTPGQRGGRAEVPRDLRARGRPPGRPASDAPPRGADARAARDPRRGRRARRRVLLGGRDRGRRGRIAARPAPTSCASWAR